MFRCVLGFASFATAGGVVLIGPGAIEHKPFLQLVQISCNAMFAAQHEIGEPMTDTTASASLYERTLYLAQNAPRSVKQCQMAAHIGVSDAWISRFVRGKLPNPGVVECQRLHDFLSSVDA